MSVRTQTKFPTAVGRMLVVQLISDGESAGGILLPGNFKPEDARRARVLSIGGDAGERLPELDEGNVVHFMTQDGSMVNIGEGILAVRCDMILCVSKK